MHGLADLTAPYQHGISLARALTEAGVLFRYQSYADEGHELQNVLEHVYSSMQSFFEECLSLDIDERDKDKNTWRLVSHLILRHRVTAFGTVPVTADSPAATAHPTWPRLRKHPKKHNSRQSELVNSINNQAVYIIAELSELSV
jgi:hypothetical protein